jgi:hydrogenase nickel incorporation protein HypB
MRNVLDANDLIAAQNRRDFDAGGCCVINLMSAPGGGKTTLLERTIAGVRGRLRVGVIEGDVQGRLDADRLALLGVPVAQINTDPHFGGECHLDARMVRSALADFPLDGLDLVLIENVGNLVCPAQFSVGEDRKVMVSSVAEGDDKPLKYPLLFRVSNFLILNKIDLLGHVDFDPERFRANVARVNADLPVIELSAMTGAGCMQWIDWLLSEVERRRSRCHSHENGF